MMQYYILNVNMPNIVAWNKYFFFNKVIDIFAFYFINMLQRIQSVYLVLVIFCSIAVCFFPLFRVPVPDGIYSLSITKTSFIGKVNVSDLSYNFPLILLSFLILILSVVTIFRYNNRKLQLNFITIILILVLVFTGVLIFDYYQLVSLSGSANTASLSYILIVVPIMLILLFLARNAIKKDEVLVRSADRLR